jgi:CheY-like chemotaxis protein
VAVESAVGEGSCFTVWLPLRTSESEVLTTVKAPVSPPINPMATSGVALVLEDDLKTAELIRIQLQSEGFTVVHAESAEAALALAIQQPLSLITMDILLPGMDGWEFLHRLKQIPELRSIPVVIVSMVADTNRGLSLGAAAVMQKPISRLQLYEALVGLSLFPPPQGKKLTFLVADDDPEAVDVIALLVAGMAGTILRAHGGREAIEMAMRELPDVIVLDLMMPEVNGFDVVAALKERAETAHIPVLVVTARHITAEDRDRLTLYGATIMQKAGFDAELFSSEVRRAMSGRRRLA